MVDRTKLKRRAQNNLIEQDVESHQARKRSLGGQVRVRKVGGSTEARVGGQGRHGGR
jgi:hypothetical protein